MVEFSEVTRRRKQSFGSRVRGDFPRGRPRWAVLGFAGAVAVACSSIDRGDPGQGSSIPERFGYLAVAKWERRLASGVPGSPYKTALSAAPGVAAFLLSSPCMHGIVAFHESPYASESGPCPDSGYRQAYLGSVSDVVYADPKGIAWWLGGKLRTVVAENISGSNSLLTWLPSAGPVLAACSTDGRIISYVDSSKPGRLNFHDVTVPQSNWSIDLPPDFRSLSDSLSWNGVQLGGVPEGPCVLIEPRVAKFAVFQADSMVRSVSFHEPIPPPPPAHRSPGLLRLFRRFSQQPQLGPIDATAFRWGIAVLYRSATHYSGRLVDLYDLEGRYWQTMILPEEGIRIASTGRELLVLSNRKGDWFLSLYPLPGHRTDSLTMDTARTNRLPEGRRPR